MKKCTNPADISDRIDDFIEKFDIPSLLIYDLGPLNTALNIETAKHYIYALKKYTKEFTQNEIEQHNQHESDCHLMNCEYAIRKKIIEQREAERNKSVKNKPTRAKNPGLIYFIHGNTLTKIGKTTNLEQRRRWLEIKMPFACEVLHTIRTNDIFTCELNFHEKYADKRKNGEWFDLSNNDLDEIKKIGEMNF